MKKSQIKQNEVKRDTVIVHGVHVGKTQIIDDDTNNKPATPRTKLLTQFEIDHYAPKTEVRPLPKQQDADMKTKVINRRQSTVVIGIGRKIDNTTSVPQKDWPQGWLVVVEGPMKGRTFPITYGYNHIGRDASNKICLSEDPGVSSVQCVVHYDRDKRIFYIKKFDQCTQETRLSDETLVDGSTVPLEAGEVIKLSSQTKLRFMPFCGDYFNWDYES